MTSITNTATIKFKRLHPEAKLPLRMTPGSIGLDVFACIWSETGRRNNLQIPAWSTRNVPTGLAIECPPDFHIEVRSRSGLAKTSLLVANSPGTIDPDYRGELQILLYNGSSQSTFIQHHWRIAQLIVMPAIYSVALEVDQLTSTERGDKGFGSTGLD